MERLVVNISGTTRKETLHGRAFTVAPMVMLVEGVHPGSNGPLLYTANELRKSPVVWNSKPIVVYHPTANGQYVSACSPEVMQSRQVGMIMNTKYVARKPANGTTPAEPGKLIAEAWIEDSLAANVDTRVVDALTNNTMMELSTGVFTDNEATPGVFNEKRYVGVARNYRPDHLALLPDKTGACSIADGAGFLRVNEAVDYRTALTANAGSVAKSFDDIQSDLRALLDEKYPSKVGMVSVCCWICDVYDKYFVYRKDSEMYKQSYNVDADGETSLVGDPTEVVRVSEYRELDGTRVIGNTASTGDTQVDKKAKVDALIANGKQGWTEADRAFLMASPDASVDRLVANMQVAPAGNVTPATVPGQPAPVANTAPAPAPVAPATPNGVVTVNDYLNLAPVEIRGMLVNGMNQYNRSCAETIQKIMAAPGNTFTVNTLQAMPLDTLNAMAALIPAPAAPQLVQPVANWLGNVQFPVNPTPGQTAPVANGTAPVANGAQPGALPTLGVPKLW